MANITLTDELVPFVCTIVLTVGFEVYLLVSLVFLSISSILLCRSLCRLKHIFPDTDEELSNLFTSQTPPVSGSYRSKGTPGTYSFFSCEGCYYHTLVGILSPILFIFLLIFFLCTPCYVGCVIHSSFKFARDEIHKLWQKTVPAKLRSGSGGTHGGSAGRHTLTTKDGLEISERKIGGDVALDVLHEDLERGRVLTVLETQFLPELKSLVSARSLGLAGGIFALIPLVCGILGIIVSQILWWYVPGVPEGTVIVGDDDDITQRDPEVFKVTGYVLAGVLGQTVICSFLFWMWSQILRKVFGSRKGPNRTLLGYIEFIQSYLEKKPVDVQEELKEKPARSDDPVEYPNATIVVDLGGDDEEVEEEGEAVYVYVDADGQVIEDYSGDGEDGEDGVMFVSDSLTDDDESGTEEDDEPKKTKTMPKPKPMPMPVAVVVGEDGEQEEEEDEDVQIAVAQLAAAIDSPDSDTDSSSSSSDD